jgi:hypothetical protein
MRTASPRNANGKPNAIENALGFPTAASVTAGIASNVPRFAKT